MNFPWETIQCIRYNDLIKHIAALFPFGRCVPDDYLPGEKAYPAYCAGMFIAYGRSIVDDLYNMAMKTPYLFIDDAWLTGIVREQVSGISFDNQDFLIGELPMIISIHYVPSAF